jgi:hypothetical protein
LSPDFYGYQRRSGRRQPNSQPIFNAELAQSNKNCRQAGFYLFKSTGGGLLIRLPSSWN